MNAIQHASDNRHGEMTPKEYLSQLWKLRVLIEQRKRQLESLNSSKFSSHIEYGKTPSGNRPTGAPFESIAIRAVDLSAEIARMIEEYNRLKNSIIGMIHQLDKPEHIQVLYKRYVEEKRLETIAREMNYNYDYIRHLHGKALHAFGMLVKIIKNMEDDTQ